METKFIREGFVYILFERTSALVEGGGANHKTIQMYFRLHITSTACAKGHWKALATRSLLSLYQLYVKR